MTAEWNRRDVLKGFVAASAAMIVPSNHKGATASRTGQRFEIQITSINAGTFRLSILPLNNGSVGSIPFKGALVQESWGPPTVKLQGADGHAIVVGSLRLKISLDPVNITVANERGDVVQQLSWDENTGILSFLHGSAPLFG